LSKVYQDFTFFYKKNIHARNAKLSIFKIFLSYTIIFSSILLASYWCQQHKWFFPNCTASSWHCIWVHHQFQISVLLGAPSLVKTNKDHWRLSQGCKEDGSQFLSSSLPLSPSPKLPYVDECCHAVGWFLWQFPKSFLLITWCTITARQLC
jgi:hypothetical protein